jgi:hypothetical protein
MCRIMMNIDQHTANRLSHSCRHLDTYIICWMHVLMNFASKQRSLSASMWGVCRLDCQVGINSIQIIIVSCKPLSCTWGTLKHDRTNALTFATTFKANVWVSFSVSFYLFQLLDGLFDSSVIAVQVWSLHAWSEGNDKVRRCSLVPFPCSPTSAD